MSESAKAGLIQTDGVIRPNSINRGPAPWPASASSALLRCRSIKLTPLDAVVEALVRLVHATPRPS